MLVDLYERDGTPERLEAAINVCRYLESKAPDSRVLGRLAKLHRLLGHEPEATRYGQRQLEAFRRGMHRVDEREIVEVCARHYIPLARLRTERFAAPAPWPDAARREIAMARALGNDPHGACDLLRGSDELLDRKYEAELLQAMGDGERVPLLWIDVLREDPRDLHVLGILGSELRASLMGLFVIVREYARVTFPELVVDLTDHVYMCKMSKDDETSHRSSAGLPIAIAFLSVFLQRPVSQRVAFTGAVFADAHDVLTVRGVGDIEPKVKGAYHRDLEAAVVPAENRRELGLSHSVPLAVSRDLCRFVATLDEAVSLAFGPAVLPAGRGGVGL